MSSDLPSPTDTVFIDRLQLAVNIGPDCWDKVRPQPVDISVHLHLRPSLLKDADHLDGTVNYGHLAKRLSSLVENAQSPFKGPLGLIQAITGDALQLAGMAAARVRVDVQVPKYVLLATGFAMEVTTEAHVCPADSLYTAVRKISIRDLILPVIIGVNPCEREARQRVITNIVFFERGPCSASLDYRTVAAQLTKEIEASSFLTLEKFVLEIVRSACLVDEAVYAVTVRAQKPSALVFAQSSGVEITRLRQHFI